MTSLNTRWYTQRVVHCCSAVPSGVTTFASGGMGPFLKKGNSTPPWQRGYSVSVSSRRVCPRHHARGELPSAPLAGSTTARSKKAVAFARLYLRAPAGDASKHTPHNVLPQPSLASVNRRVHPASNAGSSDYPSLCFSSVTRTRRHSTGQGRGYHILREGFPKPKVRENRQECLKPSGSTDDIFTLRRISLPLL